MNGRPPHEPSREFQDPHRLQDDPNRHPQSLGCSICLERNRCGGVHNDAGILDCHDLCTCADKSKCDMVCRLNPSLFVARMREVGGLDFDNAPRTKANGIPTLPLVIPFVDHRYSRVEVLDEPTVALSLYKLVNFATGKLIVTSRAELAARFLIPEGAQVIVSGVDRDRQLERWWNLEDRATLLASLKGLGIILVTTPNYSVLTDVPRTDNLHSMKRILLCWTEMASAGLAAALHLNGRTEHDYVRWRNLIAERPEIENLAFEFATGCGWPERIDWHVAQLCQLADRIERPLTLAIRGGGRKIKELSKHFAQVTIIETESFSRTIRRRRAYMTEAGRLKWVKFKTPKGAPLDDLFEHNVAVVRSSYETRFPGAVFRRAFSPRPQRATDRDGEAIQPRFLSEFDVAGEARSVSPEPEHMVTATKS